MAARDPASLSSPTEPLSAGPNAGHNPPSTGENWHRWVFVLFLLVWAVNGVVLLLAIKLPLEGRWVEMLLFVSATATTLCGLCRRLPAQNVLMAAVLIGAVSSVITAVGSLSGIPFGPFLYRDGLGTSLFGVVPWTIPFLWVVLIINGRGVARLIMRPWRRTGYYGLWVMGLTGVLVVLFDLGFEPFAVEVKNYWLWKKNESNVSWHTAPWVNFLGWFASSAAILLFTVPWLINKQPVKRPPDYHPLTLWLLLNSWVALGNGVYGLWVAVLLSVLANSLVAFGAIRGARW